MDFSFNTENINTEDKENSFSSQSNDKPAAVAKSGDLKGRLVGLDLDPMSAKSDENLKNSSKIKANWDCYWNSKSEKNNTETQEKAEDQAYSDKNLKNVNPDIDILDDYSKIDAYAYKYNKKAHDLYGNQKGIDDELHVGPMAQDLEKTNSTKASVSEDPNGYKEVDIRKLTLSNTAAISELVRKIEALEKMVGGK